MAEPTLKLFQDYKLRDLFLNGILQSCQQVTDGWGVLTPEEKSRIEQFAESKGIELEGEIALRLERMVDHERASGSPYFAATEKGIAIKEGKVTVTMEAARDLAPEKLYNHRRSFLVILTDRKLTLDEFEQQADMFPSDSSDSDGATEAPAAAETVETAGDNFDHDAYQDWNDTLQQLMEGRGVDENEIRRWVASDEALRDIFDRGIRADTVAYNVAHHGTLETPIDDGRDDTGN